MVPSLLSTFLTVRLMLMLQGDLVLLSKLMLVGMLLLVMMEGGRGDRGARYGSRK